MFSQKRKEIADLAKQFRTEYKKECEADQTKAEDRASKSDWFLKACGVGIILLGLWGLDQHPAYALIFIGIGIACCFAAHSAPPPED